MEWKEINNPPKELFGWFAAAVLPRNHSGSEEKDSTGVNGDNQWRKSFGFSKVWLNNGEWYESDMHGKSRNITRFVTHWDYLPCVPVLSESFKHSATRRFNERSNKEQTIELAMREWESDQKTNPNPVNPYAFSYGFIAAFKYLGLL